MTRYFKDATSWVLPTLYVLLKDLRRLAQKVYTLSPISIQLHADISQADSVPFRNSQGSKMEDAARTCNKAFALCMSDRNPVIESRRWGSYYLAGLVMKCYFKVSCFLCLWLQLQHRLDHPFGRFTQSPCHETLSEGLSPTLKYRPCHSSRSCIKYEMSLN